MSTPEERRSLFRVVRGTPDDAELAALAAVLSAVSSGPPSQAPAPRASTWNDPAARMRGPVPVGPHAWRTSTWPL